ncbi:MAG: ABC transporter ATP-binding protein [Proteobacteria bacterium]|nr:ABC transporter ATP-binding protein [Pseudomonadota bacterium]
MTDIAIDIQKMTKLYGSFVALRDVSLSIMDNEFFTLLGPSGCGKTTLLRTIAGFEDITKGAIRLYGEDIADLPPNKRPINTVFQQYALFPHMNVTDNVKFGLLRLGQDNATANARVGEVLELVQLTSFADRLPAQLSGGQQQRVALARALAPNPKVLLLDEPLSALDLKLRQAVRLELQQIQHETGITFIFVTHDQEEALTMSDRIAVIADGQLQQVGTAREIYEAPSNKFVAGFIGETNLIDVTVTDVSKGQATCTLPNGVAFNCPASDGARTGVGHLSVRPERVTMTSPAKGLLQGTASRQVYLGTDMHVEVTLDDQEVVTVRVQSSENNHVPAIGEVVGLNFEAGAARLLAD